MERLDDYAVDKLNLTPPSSEKLHRTLTNFELKWENKMRGAHMSDRISRF